MPNSSTSMRSPRPTGGLPSATARSTCWTRRVRSWAAGYFATSGRPQNQPFAQLLLKNGLQQPDGIETDLGTAIGKLRQIA